MTDAFESEVQKFVDKENGGDLTPRVVYGMLKAVDHDAEARHEQSMERFEMVEGAMADHVKWTNENSLPRLEAVEAIVEDLGCIRSEHEAMHRQHLEVDHAPRRASDPPDASFREQRGQGDADKLYAGEFVAAEKSRVALTREGIVANFWILVALLVLSGVVNGLVDMLFNR